MTIKIYLKFIPRQKLNKHPKKNLIQNIILRGFNFIRLFLKKLTKTQLNGMQS